MGNWIAKSNYALDALKSSLFGHLLTPEELQSFIHFGTTEQYGCNVSSTYLRILPNQCFHLILSGQVVAYLSNEKGQQTVITTYQPGDIIYLLPGIQTSKGTITLSSNYKIIYQIRNNDCNVVILTMERRDMEDFLSTRPNHPELERLFTKNSHITQELLSIPAFRSLSLEQLILMLSVMKLQAVQCNDILQDSSPRSKKKKKVSKKKRQQQQQKCNGENAASPSSLTSSSVISTTKGEAVTTITPPPSVMEDVKLSSSSSSSSWLRFRPGNRSVLPIASVFFCIHGVVDELLSGSDINNSVGDGNSSATTSMTTNRASMLQPQHGLWGLDNCFIMRWNTVKDQHPSPIVKAETKSIVAYISLEGMITIMRREMILRRLLRRNYYFHLVQRLRELQPFLRDMDENRLRSLCGRIRLHGYDSEELVFEKDQPAQMAYFIAAGQVQITNDVFSTTTRSKRIMKDGGFECSNGNKAVTWLLNQGELLGREALRSPASSFRYSAITTEPSIMICISMQSLEETFALYPQPLSELMIRLHGASSDLHPIMDNAIGGTTLQGFLHHYRVAKQQQSDPAAIQHDYERDLLFYISCRRYDHLCERLKYYIIHSLPLSLWTKVLDGLTARDAVTACQPEPGPVSTTSSYASTVTSPTGPLAKTPSNNTLSTRRAYFRSQASSRLSLTFGMAHQSSSSLLNENNNNNNEAVSTSRRTPPRRVYDNEDSISSSRRRLLGNATGTNAIGGGPGATSPSITFHESFLNGNDLPGYLDQRIKLSMNQIEDELDRLIEDIKSMARFLYTTYLTPSHNNSLYSQNISQLYTSFLQQPLSIMIAVVLEDLLSFYATPVTEAQTMDFSLQNMDSHGGGHGGLSAWGMKNKIALMIVAILEDYRSPTSEIHSAMSTARDEKVMDTNTNTMMVTTTTTGTSAAPLPTTTLTTSPVINRAGLKTTISPKETVAPHCLFTSIKEEVINRLQPIYEEDFKKDSDFKVLITSLKPYEDPYDHLVVTTNTATTNSIMMSDVDGVMMKSSSILAVKDKPQSINTTKVSIGCNGWGQKGQPHPGRVYNIQDSLPLPQPAATTTITTVTNTMANMSSTMNPTTTTVATTPAIVSMERDNVDVVEEF